MRERLSAIELVLIASALAVMGSTLLGPTGASAQISDEESDEVTVTHEGPSEAVGPGESVEFTVSIMNNTDSELANVGIAIDFAEEIFGERYEPLEPSGDGGLFIPDGGFGWTGRTIAAGQAESFSYRVQAVSNFATTRTDQNQAIVTGDGLERTTSAEFGTAAFSDFMETTHQATGNELISTGESTTFEITVSNTNAASAIGGDLQVTLEDPVFTELRSLAAQVEEADAEGEDQEDDDEGARTLVWRDVSVAPGDTQTFRYEAIAGPDGSASPTVSMPASFVGFGSEVSISSAPAKVAAAPGSITVTHQAVETKLEPGAMVDFVVTVTNNSGADRNAERVEVRIEAEPDLFADWQFGPCNEEPTADPVLEDPLLEGGEQFSIQYCALVKPEFGTVVSGTNRAVVTVAEQELPSEPTGDLRLTSALDSLHVDHQPDSDDDLQPGGLVAYTVEVRNLSKVATIRDIEITVSPDGRVYEGDPKDNSSTRPASTEGDALAWKIDSLGPDQAETLRYVVTAAVTLPDGEISVQNMAEVAAPGGSRPEPSGELAIAGASSDDPQPSIEGRNLFILIIIYLVLSFVSAVYLILNHRWGRRNNEVGLYLFTTISLLSATLILAFGSTVPQEGALSLLAAIAGYVLGRRFGAGGRGDDDDEEQPTRRRPPAPDGDAGPDREPSSPTRAAAGSSAVATKQPIMERVGRIGTVADESPVNTWLLLASPLLTPVLIVITTLWLLDATGSSITRDTYLSSAVITALVLLFIAITGYLLLGRSREPEPPNTVEPDPDAEAGPDPDPDPDPESDPEPE